MKKDWDSHIRVKNPIDITPAKAGGKYLSVQAEPGFRLSPE
jgi:hypothetical protein